MAADKPPAEEASLADAVGREPPPAEPEPADKPAIDVAEAETQPNVFAPEVPQPGQCRSRVSRQAVAAAAAVKAGRPHVRRAAPQRRRSRVFMSGQPRDDETGQQGQKAAAAK